MMFSGDEDTSEK